MGFVYRRHRSTRSCFLNSNMRTDMLQHIHFRLHKMRDEDGPGLPLHHMAKSLEQVIDTWDGINLFECFTATNSTSIRITSFGRSRITSTTSG